MKVANTLLPILLTLTGHATHAEPVRTTSMAAELSLELACPSSASAELQDHIYSERFGYTCQLMNPYAHTPQQCFFQVTDNNADNWRLLDGDLIEYNLFIVNI